MVATILASIALGLSLLALIVLVALAKYVGTQDPLALPKSWRRLLGVKVNDLLSAESLGSHRDGQRVAFVVNPTKAGALQLRELAMRACAVRYLPQPMWFYTTADNPGTKQTQAAVAAGADLVVAIGGDGTVRAVAEGLVGTSAALGIIPAGTGNIFARNLDLPLADADALVRSALDGLEEAVDVGWIEIIRPYPDHAPGGKHLFLVMAGAGIDAEMVAGADDKMKRRWGWPAYFFAALKHLRGKSVSVTVQIDGQDEVPAQVRSVLMANVGRLPGGFNLIPDASGVDGALDIVSLDARGGIVGWTDLLGTVIAQGAGIRPTQVSKTWRASRLDHIRAQAVTVEMATPQKVQADGESLGRAFHIAGWVDPGALRVRLPNRESPSLIPPSTTAQP